MIPYIISLREQNTVIQGQVAGEAAKNQRTKAQVGRMQQDVEATKQDLAATKDTTKKTDPKITRLGQVIDAAAQDLGSRVATVKDTVRQTASQVMSVGIKAEQALANTVALSSDLSKAKQDTQTRVASVGIKAEQALANTVALSSDLSKAKQDTQVRTGQLKNDLDETTSLAHAAQTAVQQQSNRFQGHLALHDDSILRFSEALSGNIKLYAEAIAADLSAAALNAAAAGTFTRDLTISLVSEMGEGEAQVRYVHPWALLPVVISAEASADPDIAAPTVKDHDDPLVVPQFNSGVLSLVVIFDTDAGVTKTYAAEDELTVTVKVSATVGATPNTSKLLGWDVADLTMTYTVIA